MSDASASIYLNGISDSKQTTKYEHIKTNNTWKTYYFYISTSSFSSEKDITLQLYLGNKVDSCQGAVFFSDIKIEQYSEANYTKELTAELKEKSNVNSIELNSSYVYDLIVNPSFESNINKWNTIGSAHNGDIFSTVIDTTTTGYIKGNAKYPAIPSNNNTSESNINALALYSKPDTDTSTYYGVESNTFVIEQYKLYRISIWAYSNSGSSDGAYITLLDTDNPETKVSKQISTSANSSNSLSNNWSEYEFYIQGHSLRDVNFKMQLTIGTSDKKDSSENYAIFDDVRIQEINYTQFNSGKSSDNTLSLTPEQSSDFIIKNYSFDSIENNNEDGTKPLTPAGWTLNNENEYIFAGIVNTNTEHFENNVKNYGKVNNIINPGKIDTYSPIDTNNILMLGTSNLNQNISYTTTEKFTLTSSKYYELSFDVYTQHLNDSNIGANFQIIDSNNVEILAINNIKTNNEWTHYTYYIATDLVDKSCDAVLSLNNVSAYAYFDNIKLSEIEETLYSELLETKDHSLFIDLSKNLFASPSSWKTTDNQDRANVYFLTPSEYEISVDNEHIAQIVAETEEVAYYLTRLDQLNVSASSYYKISVYVNTKNIRKADNSTGDFGATFYVKYKDKLDGIENIVTNENDFVKYVIYLDTQESTTVDILLGLGTEDNKVLGETAFTKLELVKFENEEAMTADKETNSNLVTKTITIKPDNTSSDTDTDKTTPYSATPNWLAISSLVTSVAMIIAIIAFFLRKINFKKRRRKVTTNYDRRKTLDKRFDMKERIEYREDLIDKLQIELDEINDIKKAYTQEHQEKMKSLESSANASSDSLKQQLKDLYKKKIEISKEHNKLIAQDKLNASKEEDLIFDEKITKIENQEKTINKKIKHIEKARDKQQEHYEDLIARADKRQEDIRAEINAINQEIDTIKEEINNLNKGK